MNTNNLTDKQKIELNLRVLKEILKEELKTSREALDYTTVNYETINLSNVTNNYDKELVQVAASAIAALVDYQLNTIYKDVAKTEEDVDNVTNIVIKWVLQERKRQDAKFKPLPRNLDPLVWLAVIVEEIAEVAEEIIVY